MIQDFPAAHSMDTDWFSVDADGNIALFHSGEGGAVPQSNRDFIKNTKIVLFEDLFITIANEHPHRLVLVETNSEIISKSLTLQKLQKHIDGWVSFEVRGLDKNVEKVILISRCLLLLSSDNVIPELKIGEIEYGYILRFAGEKVIVYVNYCYIPIIQKLIKEGKILAGRECYVNDLVGLLGFFYYECDSGAPIPYRCIGKPINPLKLEDLPEYMQESIIENSFDSLKFSETKMIQPIEHTQCDTWGSDWWMDTQGNEREGHPHDPT